MDYLLQDKKTIPLVAQSTTMLKLLRDAKLAAMSRASIFLQGESGTGKEVFASYIHSFSARARTPFIKVNVAAIPEMLLESELFGHEKGAFTGALAMKKGRFELAEGGTLLLDEITEMPLALQPKLLRAIQEGCIERLGAVRSIPTDVRFICTSNRNIQESLKDGTFRPDLYYRLNVIGLHIPPLRERKEDILPLIHHFLERTASENQIPLKQLSKDAQQALMDYPYPGNVRELANILERAMILSPTQTIEVTDLALPHHSIDRLTSTPLSLYEVEKHHIQQALRYTSGNKTQAAQLLKISTRTLRNKLKHYLG